MGRLLTIQEVVKESGFSRRSLYRHMDAGVLKYKEVQVGLRTRRMIRDEDMRIAYSCLSSLNVASVPYLEQSVTSPCASGDGDIGNRRFESVEEENAKLIKQWAEARLNAYLKTKLFAHVDF